jgi:ATP-dependent exoDNAse (exonuclease V) beta subunit
MSMKLSPAQQAAVEMRKNVVVSAGAGSGKTTVLTERFLSLIRNGEAEIDQIMAVTFTRKAAAEMRERIYKRLLTEQGNPRIDHALVNFQRAHISTIDSFLSGILRQDSARYGFAPDFSVDEDRLRQFVERQAVDFLLNRGTELQSMVNGFSIDILFRNLLVKTGREFSNLLEDAPFSSALERQNTLLKDAYKDLRNKILHHLALEGDISYRTKSQLAWQPYFEQIRELLEDVSSIEEFSTGKGILQKPPRLPSGKDDATDQIKEIQEAIKDPLIHLDSMLYFKAHFEDLKQLAKVLDDFSNELNIQRKAMGLVSYRDLLLLSRDILIHNDELRQYYKQSLKFIMIDEFQDNNQMQKEILYLLAQRMDINTSEIPEVDQLEPGKLFFVGDEKQSIYRFRGADVSVFKALEEELGEGLALHMNYRSQPNLIDFFNKIFPRIMESEVNAAFEARFIPLEPRSDQSVEPQIELWFRDGTEDESHGYKEDEIEAYFIARKIKDTVEGRTKLEVHGEAGSRRKPVFEDFAILLRSRTNQQVLEKALRQADVPYNSSGQKLVFMEAPYFDLRAVFQIYQDFNDRTALAGLLRSPLVNLSDHVIERILNEAASMDDMAEFLEGVSGDDAEKISLWMEWMQEWVVLVETKGIAAALAYLWEECGYKYHILANPRLHSFAEHFSLLLDMAIESDRRLSGVSGFLKTLDDAAQSFNVMDDPEGGAKNGVNILTIHKSKGLEFPIVFLASAGSYSKNHDNSLPVFWDDDMGPVLKLGQKEPPSYWYLAVKAREKAEELAESKRLLYVAMTRAEDHLIISGRYYSQNKNSDHMLNLVLDGIRCEREYEAIVKHPLVRHLDAAEVKPGYMASSSLKQFASVRQTEPWKQKTGFFERAVSSLNMKHEYDAPAAVSTVSKNSGAAFGTLVHGYLEYWVGSLEPDLELCSGLLSPWPEQEAAEVFAEAEKLALGFIDSELAADARSMGIAEVPFYYCIDENAAPLFLSGTMDLVIEYPDRILVVDYKTDLELDVQHYIPQMSIYRYAAQSLFQKPVEVEIFALRDKIRIQSEYMSQKELYDLHLDGMNAELILDY